ncbi:MAG: poly-gamma-glutamate hydrolase family protein [Chloroflexota bacterium]
MADHYYNYDEMSKDLVHNQHYRKKIIERKSGLIVLAIHGGGIEPGTSELAMAIAGKEHSFYLFEGTGGRNNDLHITSTRFNDPECLSLVAKHSSAVSIHGFIESENDPQIYMGGCDRLLMNFLLEALNANGFQSLVNTKKYAATDQNNICNRTSSGKGVQIELSGTFRRQLFQNYSSRGGRMNVTPEFTRFVQTIRNVLSQSF